MTTIKHAFAAVLACAALLPGAGFAQGNFPD